MAMAVYKRPKDLVEGDIVRVSGGFDKFRASYVTRVSERYLWVAYGEHAELKFLRSTGMEHCGIGRHVYPWTPEEIAEYQADDVTQRLYSYVVNAPYRNLTEEQVKRIYKIIVETQEPADLNGPDIWLVEPPH
jgi:hypothetical protein